MLKFYTNHISAQETLVTHVREPCKPQLRNQRRRANAVWRKNLRKKWWTTCLVL